MPTPKLRPIKGCLGILLLLPVAFFVTDLVLELNFRRVPNQISIIAKAVGPFSCDSAEIVEANWNSPSIFNGGNSYDDMRMSMPRECVERLEAMVTKLPAFRIDNCSEADRCWTNHLDTASNFVELHFLEDGIIFRHISQ